MKFGSSKYLTKLYGLDIFGHQVSVNYQGSQTYNTYVSAVVSLITVSLIVMNFVLLSMGYRDGSLQDEKTTFIQVDRFDSEAYNLAENGFEITLFVDQEQENNTSIDPELNQFSVYQIEPCGVNQVACNAKKTMVGVAGPCPDAKTEEINGF